ncbi:POK18 protein, partial [Bucco capensis]|nr:POK18 protein [Bucco capensis]
VELSVVVRVFKLWTNSVNIVTDSAYVAGTVSRIKAAYLKEMEKPSLFSLLKQLHALITLTHYFYITHVTSHTNRPGPIMEGNRRADLLAGTVQTPNIFEQARLSHLFFYQNAKVLQKMSGLTMQQARQIVVACRDCQILLPSLQPAVSP